MKTLANNLFRATGVAALMFASACGDDAPSESVDSPDAEHVHDASVASGDSGEEATDEVPCDADYPSFTPGMSVKAGELTVKLKSINPAPPRQKVRNDWVLEVVGADGQPLSGLTFLNAESYMPVHRHGGKTQPQSTPTGEAGTYGLANIDFIMRGPWQVLFDIDQAGSKLGMATIQICVE